MLMEEFKSAHMKMFGKQQQQNVSHTLSSNLTCTSDDDEGSIESGKASESKSSTGDSKLSAGDFSCSSGVSSIGSSSPSLSSKSSISSCPSEGKITSKVQSSNDCIDSEKKNDHQSPCLSDLKQSDHDNDANIGHYKSSSNVLQQQQQQFTLDHNSKVRILKTALQANNGNNSSGNLSNNNAKLVNGQTINVTGATKSPGHSHNNNNSSNNNNINSNSNSIGSNGRSSNASVDNNSKSQQQQQVQSNGMSCSRKTYPAPPPPPPPLPTCAGSNSKVSPSVTITSYRRASSSSIAPLHVPTDDRVTTLTSTNKPLPVKINLIQSTDCVSRM